MSSGETMPSIDPASYEGDDDDGYSSCSYDEDGENRQSGGSVGEKYTPFRQYLVSKGFKKVGWGSFRATYQRGKIVIKVPRNRDGEIDNRVEARAWRKYKNKPTTDGVPLAPCRLLPNGCLMMVSVEEAYFDDLDDIGAPVWMRFIEGWQIGNYREKMVAYDYALDIPERASWEKEWGVQSEYFQQELA